MFDENYMSFNTVCAALTFSWRLALTRPNEFNITFKCQAPMWWPIWPWPPYCCLWTHWGLLTLPWSQSPMGDGLYFHGHSRRCLVCHFRWYCLTYRVMGSVCGDEGVDFALQFGRNPRERPWNRARCVKWSSVKADSPVTSVKGGFFFSIPVAHIVLQKKYCMWYYRVHC